jgi:hypothetical protein
MNTRRLILVKFENLTSNSHHQDTKNPWYLGDLVVKSPLAIMKELKLNEYSSAVTDFHVKGFHRRAKFSRQSNTQPDSASGDIAVYREYPHILSAQFIPLGSPAGNSAGPAPYTVERPLPASSSPV